MCGLYIVTDWQVDYFAQGTQSNGVTTTQWSSTGHEFSTGVAGYPNWPTTAWEEGEITIILTYTGSVPIPACVNVKIDSTSIVSVQSVWYAGGYALDGFGDPEVYGYNPYPFNHVIESRRSSGSRVLTLQVDGTPLSPTYKQARITLSVAAHLEASSPIGQTNLGGADASVSVTATVLSP